MTTDDAGYAATRMRARLAIRQVAIATETRCLGVAEGRSWRAAARGIYYPTTGLPSVTTVALVGGAIDACLAGRGGRP